MWNAATLTFDGCALAEFCRLPTRPCKLTFAQIPREAGFQHNLLSIKMASTPASSEVDPEEDAGTTRFGVERTGRAAEYPEFAIIWSFLQNFRHLLHFPDLSLDDLEDGFNSHSSKNGKYCNYWSRGGLYVIYLPAAIRDHLEKIRSPVFPYNGWSFRVHCGLIGRDPYNHSLYHSRFCFVC